jgi:hypothetical protein
MKINIRKFGQVLVWIGVATWMPYFYLAFTGAAPPIYVFLPVHLGFVLTGVRLKKLSQDQDRRPIKFKQASQILLYIGLAAWLPYFYVHYYYQLEVGHIPFLVLHLFGMIGGGILRLF